MFIKAFRYIIAVPAGAIAGLLIMFPVHWVILFFNWCKPGDYGVITDGQCAEAFPWGLINPETLERLVQGAVIPFTIIYIGSKIIPNSSKWIPIWLGVIAYGIIWLGYVGMWSQAKNPAVIGYSGWMWIELVLLVLIHHLSIGITVKTLFNDRTRKSDR